MAGSHLDCQSNYTEEWTLPGPSHAREGLGQQGKVSGGFRQDLMGSGPVLSLAHIPGKQGPAASDGAVSPGSQSAGTRPQQWEFNRREAYFSAQGLLRTNGTHLFARCFQGAALVCVVSPLSLLHSCSALAGGRRERSNRRTSLDQRVRSALLLTFYWLGFGYRIARLQGRLGNVVLYSE